MSAREPLAKDPIGLARDNWVTHGWEDAADGMHLVTSIMRVQQAYLGRIEAILRPMGLTFARFEVLRLLAFSRLGSLPVGKVGERLQVLQFGRGLCLALASRTRCSGSKPTGSWSGAPTRATAEGSLRRSPRRGVGSSTNARTC